MITHTVSPTKNGNFCAEVVFRFGNRKHRLPRFCSDLPRATREVDHLKKRILIDELQKFINHRLKVILRYGGVMTYDRLKVIERLQKLIDMSRGDKCTLLLFARRITDAADSLVCLIPGARSRYHQNQECFVSELLSDCKDIINEYRHEPLAS